MPENEKEKKVYVVVCNDVDKPFRFGQSDCFDGVFDSKAQADGYVKAMNAGSNVIVWRVFEETLHGSEDPLLSEFSNLQEGEEFTFEGRHYVKTPELKLHCNNWGFLTNCIETITPEDEWVPPTHKADYFCQSTVVKKVS